MILLIGGHQRSGTTLLGELCNHHRDIIITREFGNFLALGRPYQAYSRQILNRWWTVQSKWAFEPASERHRLMRLHNFLFVLRYLLKVHRVRQGHVDLGAIETALRSLFPAARFVGDKWPGFVFSLDKFVEKDGIYLLMIYRDCRDVVSSTLEQVRTSWRKSAFAEQMNTAEKVARRWVRAIEEMERYRNRLHIICYEDLICKTQQELHRLGEWLGVSPQEFSIQPVRDTSVGKHKKGLSADELSVVLEIAGPTMARLGYL
ncbi:MAG: sulfotransferase [Candidatus Binatia bacterium]